MVSAGLELSCPSALKKPVSAPVVSVQVVRQELGAGVQRRVSHTEFPVCLRDGMGVMIMKKSFFRQVLPSG